VEYMREGMRGEAPAVTHLDNSARVQTVTREANPLFWELLRAFLERTGCAMLVNTSFNVRGEPIVCTPEDAYLGFARTEIDILVVGPFVLERAEQDFRSSALASALPNFAPD